MTAVEPIAQRIGRVAFGAVLIAGTVVMVACPIARYLIILASWCIAIGSYALVTRIRWRAPRIPQAWRIAGLVIPAVGAALILPLTLHLPIVVVFWGTRAFDDWCLLSICWAMFGHVVFALFAGLRAYALAVGNRPMSVQRIYGVTVFASAFPVVIPSLFVAITGLPILPLLRYMERVAAADHSPSLPRAIVVV